MDDADAALLRLADPAQRASLLGSDDLLQVALASYALDEGSVVGATTAVFDRVDLTVTLVTDVQATYRWGRATDPLATEGTATLSGLAAPQAGADAVWTGSVVVRTSGGDGLITVADPSDAGRTPDGIDHLGVGLTFSAPPAVLPATPPLVLPVVVAFLVAATGEGPISLLRRTDAARRAAARYPVLPPPAVAPLRTRERCVCWVLPATAFDDDGWPGGGAGTPAQQRAARLAAARGWLTTQGVALVTT
ncbi:hypothetical protein [Cellulomonas alba]|uniref:Uncharacterized protein n=1 Tax=Cellulomonas alba TaxID=3053467 RepID=A0ABT7SI54_9CELL|nr:hypothetical protein [Cellulomonas alba]MDM7855863.1 hypothetical protein [Cellulomonas alba]